MKEKHGTSWENYLRLTFELHTHTPLHTHLHTPTYSHTCIHIPAYILSHLQTYSYTCIHTNTLYTYTCTYTHTPVIYTYLHIYSQTCMHIHVAIHTYLHTCSHICTYTAIHILTHLHTYSNTYIYTQIHTRGFHSMILMKRLYRVLNLKYSLFLNTPWNTHWDTVIQLPIVPKSLLRAHLLNTCVKCHGAYRAERHTFFHCKVSSLQIKK